MTEPTKRGKQLPIHLFFAFTKKDLKLDELIDQVKHDDMIYALHAGLAERKDINRLLDFPGKVKINTFSLANKEVGTENEEFLIIIESSHKKILNVKFQDWLTFFHVNNLHMSVIQQSDHVREQHRKFLENSVVRFENH